MWPPFLEELNRQIGEGSNIFENDFKSKVCSEVDRLVVATCKQDCLRQYLNVSQEEAHKLENAVKKNQYHFCAGDVKCENCDRIVPSFLSCEHQFLSGLGLRIIQSATSLRCGF